MRQGRVQLSRRYKLQLGTLWSPNKGQERGARACVAPTWLPSGSPNRRHVACTKRQPPRPHLRCTSTIYNRLPRDAGTTGNTHTAFPHLPYNPHTASTPPLGQGLHSLEVLLHNLERIALPAYHSTQIFDASLTTGTFVISLEVLLHNLLCDGDDVVALPVLDQAERLQCLHHVVCTQQLG